MNVNNFLDSPLKKVAPKDIPVTPAADLLCPTDIYQVSPLARVANPTGMTILPISMQMIEDIGKGLTADVMKVTEQFVSSMPLVDADELGDLVARFNTEASKLELKDRTGIVGWVRNLIGDVKAEAYKRITTVEKSFDQLTEKMQEQVNRHKMWQGVLTTAYNENMQAYHRVRAEKQKAEGIYAACKNMLDSQPEISPTDPDAIMKGQMILEAKSMLARLANRIDNMARLQVYCENNAPKIMAQRENSQVTVETVTDIIEQALPMIKMDFMLLAQSKDIMKSNKMTESSRDLLNKSVTSSTDAMVESSIQTAMIANSPNLRTDTIVGVRERITNMVQKVAEIEHNQQLQRVADADAIQKSQAALLTVISSR